MFLLFVLALCCCSLLLLFVVAFLPSCVNNKERAKLCEPKREGQVLGTKERGLGSVNKRERARLCEHKREGQVV